MEAKGLQRPVVCRVWTLLLKPVAAMSVVLSTTCRHTHVLRIFSPPTTTAFAPGYSFSALHHSHPDPFEANCIISAYLQSSAAFICYPFFLLPRHLVQLSTSLRCRRSALLDTNLFSPLCGQYGSTALGKQKRSKHWKTKKFLYIITKAHSLLDSQMWSKIFLFSSYV